MSKAWEKKAQRCLSGGLSAGILACKLDEAKKALRSPGITGVSVKSALLDALPHAKALRKAFPTARPETREIVQTLERWNKEILKSLRKTETLAVLPGDITGAGIRDLKGKLWKAIGQGREACGRGTIGIDTEWFIRPPQPLPEEQAP